MGQPWAGWGLGFGKTGPSGFDHHHVFLCLLSMRVEEKGGT